MAGVLLAAAVVGGVAVIGLDTEDSPDRWIAPFAIAGGLFLGWRCAFRPRVLVRSDVLLVQEPWWTWVLPAGAVSGVHQEDDQLVVTTRRRTVVPFAFSPSLLARLLGDRHQRQTLRGLQDWHRDHAPERATRAGSRERRSVRGLVLDAVVCVAALQAVYYAARLAVRWGAHLG